MPVPMRQIVVPKVLTVSTDGNAQYDNLTDANADVVSGDTIDIYPGTYTDQITMVAGVTYRGVTTGSGNPEVIFNRTIGGASGGAIWTYASAGASFIENIDFNLTWNGSAGDIAVVKVTGGGNLYTVNSILSSSTSGASGGNLYGVQITTGAIISNNCSITATDAGIEADASVGLQIEGVSSSQNHINYTTCRGTVTAGVRIDNTNGNLWISNCRLGTSGLTITNANDVEVWGDNWIPTVSGINDDDTETVFQQVGYGKLLSNGQQDTYKLPLRSLSADPSTLADGMLWARTTAPHLKSRLNGSTVGILGPDFTGTVHTVHPTDPRADFTTIAAAITAATAGDTLLLGPIDFAEQITIDKNLQIIGTAANRGANGAPRTRINPGISATGAAVGRTGAATTISLIDLDVDFTWTGSTGTGTGIDGGASRWYLENVFCRGSTDTGAGAASNMTAASLGDNSRVFNSRFICDDTGSLISSGAIIPFSRVSNAGTLEMVSSEILSGANAPGDFVTAGAAGVANFRGVRVEGTLDNSAGSTVNADGGNYFQATSGTITNRMFGGAGAAPTLSKSITIEDPTATEDISIFFTNLAITITEIRAVVRGSTPSVTWTIRHGTSRSATGAEVVTGGTTTTDQSTGSDVTSFDDATIVFDSFVWLETTAQTGTVDELAITIVYTED